MKQTLAGARWAILAVATLTVLGFALRLARYQQGVFGDELSTLYAVRDGSLGDVLSYVSGDAEISPPLYFILAWLTTKLGSAPELVRLPSLIAGTISIPLVYLVGARAISRPAGLLAAAVMALSPFMIFYSADGRGYAVTIAFMLGSTLAMLAGARTGRTRWWACYGAFSLLAMYTHYTAAFALAAQLLWLLWAHPGARRPALIANAASAVLYLPWLPSLAGDTSSPTTDILYAIQGSGLEAKLRAIGNWVIGYPYRPFPDFPGLVAALLGAAGIAAAATAGLIRHLRARAAAPPGSRPPLIVPGMTLAILLAVSNIASALLFLLITGNDLLSARNLVTASAGLALLTGAVLASAGRLWGSACAILVAACLVIAAAGTLATENELPDYKAAASYIEAEAGPDDVVVDLLPSIGVTPVPLTPLDAYLDGIEHEYRVGLPKGEPPFLSSAGRPAPILLRRALRQAHGQPLTFVAADGYLFRDGDEVTAVREGPATTATFELPPGSKVVAERRFPGFFAVNVVSVEIGSGAEAR